MALAHRIFEADSDAAAHVVERYRTDSNARWRMALVGMNATLNDFGFSLAEKRDVARGARDHWSRSLSGGTELTHQLGGKFRSLRPDIECLLRDPAAQYAEGVESFERRAIIVRGAARRLRDLDRRGRLTTSLAEIAASHLHMWANRMFRGSANKHELVLYEFLFRVYDGELARSQRAAPGRRAAGAAI